MTTMLRRQKPKASTGAGATRRRELEEPTPGFNLGYQRWLHLVKIMTGIKDALGVAVTELNDINKRLRGHNPY